MYNIYKISYLIAVGKPEAANKVRAPDDERYAVGNLLNVQWNNKFYFSVAFCCLILLTSKTVTQCY
jgi:hypothetical protein